MHWRKTTPHAPVRGSPHLVVGWGGRGGRARHTAIARDISRTTAPNDGAKRRCQTTVPNDGAKRWCQTTVAIRPSLGALHRANPQPGAPSVGRRCPQGCQQAVQRSVAGQGHGAAVQCVEEKTYGPPIIARRMGAGRGRTLCRLGLFTPGRQDDRGAASLVVRRACRSAHARRRAACWTWARAAANGCLACA